MGPAIYTEIVGWRPAIFGPDDSAMKVVRKGPKLALQPLQWGTVLLRNVGILVPRARRKTIPSSEVSLHSGPKMELSVDTEV